MRDIPDKDLKERLFTIVDEDYLEIVKEAHYKELEVQVVGKSSSNKAPWVALEIEFVGSA